MVASRLVTRFEQWLVVLVGGGSNAEVAAIMDFSKVCFVCEGGLK